MSRDAYSEFSRRTVALHWLIAIAIIGVFALGTYMEDLEASPFTFQLYAIHKSIGMLILPVALYRIWWRMKNGFPEPVGAYSHIEHLAAKVVHYVLILATILMPITGIMFSGAGGFGLAIFGLELVPANFVDGKAIAHNATVAGIGHTLHEAVSNVLMVAVGLHVAGALKHHVLDKDGTLRRMLGQRI
ncbi:MAG: cytochrome b [Hyphomicrobiales bacterium]